MSQLKIDVDHLLEYVEEQGFSKMVEEIEFSVLKKLVEDGLCQSQIATRISLPYTTTGSKLRRYGLTPKQRAKELRAKIIKLQAEGKRGFMIAKELGVDPQFVYNQLRPLKKEKRLQ